MDRYTQVAENLKAAVRGFACAKEQGCVVEREGISLVASGIDFSVFNIAQLEGPLAGGEEALAQALDVAGAYFRNLKVRWSFWLCEDWLAPEIRPRVRQVLLAKRMRLQSMPPGMTADRLKPPKRDLPKLTLCRVEDKRTREDFCRVTSTAFAVPEGVTSEIYGSARLWMRSGLVGYVGYWNGAAIATAATLAAGGAIGVYSVATLPEMQRRGFGEATMRQALRDAQRASGLERTVLQSTHAGLKLYERMGYKKTAQFSIYLSE